VTGRDRPAIAAGWSIALSRGVSAFLAMAAIGQAMAFGAWAVADTGASPGAIARLGWMEFGAFHHVAIELDVPDLDVGPAAGSGATSLSIGIALLSITAVAIWLLFRGGRAVADACDGGTGARILHGAKIAPAYALPAFALSMLIQVRTPLRVGAFASGELQVSLSAWQALAFPFVIAAASGASGGLRSALDARTRQGRPLARLEAAVAGGVRMFALGLLLSTVGLFAAGVVQPDGPADLLTPSTARYFTAVLDRPAIGAVALGHHLALLPNEAAWTLVPAMGGCVQVRGSANEDLLCYRRFPTAVGTAVQPLTGGQSIRVPLGGATFGTAPPVYLLFLLVPGAATLLGGRLAARRLAAGGLESALAGAGAGVVFGVLVSAASALSTLTVGYGAGFGGTETAGWVLVGPDVLAASLLAAGWGASGGALGAATLGRIASLRSGRTEGSRSPARTRSR
jgi:hypothetical protein